MTSDTPLWSRVRAVGPFAVVLVTAVTFLVGYLRISTYYGSLGIAVEQLELGFQDFMVGATSVLALPILASFIALLANVIGAELARPLPATDEFGELVPEQAKAGLPVENVAVWLAIGSVVHEALAGRGVWQGDLLGTPALNWAFVLGLPTCIGVVSAMSTRYRHAISSLERQAWLSLKLVVLGVAIWYSGQPLFWLLLLANMLIVGVLLFLLRGAWLLLRSILRLKSRVPMSERPGWRRFARRLEFVGKATRPILGAFNVFLAVFALLIAGIVQGSATAKHEENSCEWHPLVAFDQGSGLVVTNRTYWLVAHAGGSFYLRDWDSHGPNRTVIAIPDTIQAQMWRGPAPWCSSATSVPNEPRSSNSTATGSPRPALGP